MRKIQTKRLVLRKLTVAQLTSVNGGDDPGISGRVCSIVYNCPDNTSNQASCVFTCTQCTSGTTF